MIEVEVRARIDSFKKIKIRLEELGVKKVAQKEQIDKIFGREKDLDDNHMIIEGRFSARIRSVDDATRIDFKEIIRGVGGVEVSADVSSVEQGKKFLEKIDYEEAFTIAKERTEYKIDEYKICLDDVDKLGRFIEVEKGIGEDQDKEVVYKECLELLEKLAPGSIQEKRKYGDLMQDIING